MYKNILLLLLFFCADILSQSDEKTEFQLALNLYNSYEYEEALQIFTKLAEDPFNSRTTASLLFQGKILFKLNRETGALDAFEKLYDNHPSSKYIDEARTVTADHYIQNLRFAEALSELCVIINKTGSASYSNHAKQTGKKISKLYLHSSEIDSILSKFVKTKAAPFLLLLEGMKELTSGNQTAANDAFYKIIHDYPDSEEKGEAAELINKKVSEYDNIIAALFPGQVDGVKDQAALEILEGVKFAVEEYNRTAANKVGLLLRDTERNSDKIGSIGRELKSFGGLKAVIGPVYSDEVKTVLEMLKESGIPLISPTATDNDLLVMYPLFYQANASFEFRGRMMAQYIYYVENKRKMGVLKTTDGHSSIEADAFIEEFQRIRGKIIIEESYKSGSYELNSPISRISAKTSQIEGIYLPLGNKSDAPVLLSQLETAGIDLPLYGNQDWFNAKGFESSSNLSSKLVFTSDYYIDFNDTEYQEFNTRFRELTGMEADRNVLYGYDAAKYLLSAFDGKIVSKEELRTKLESGMITRGFHNNISFDSGRINKFINILRYRDGIFDLVDRFKTGK